MENWREVFADVLKEIKNLEVIYMYFKDPIYKHSLQRIVRKKTTMPSWIRGERMDKKGTYIILNKEKYITEDMNNRITITI